MQGVLSLLTSWKVHHPAEHAVRGVQLSRVRKQAPHGCPSQVYTPYDSCEHRDDTSITEVLRSTVDCVSGTPWSLWELDILGLLLTKVHNGQILHI